MANNDMLKKRLEGITSSLSSEKAAWDTKLASTREDFMREIEGEKKEGKNVNSGNGDIRPASPAATT